LCLLIATTIEDIKTYHSYAKFGSVLPLSNPLESALRFGYLGVWGGRLTFVGQAII